MNVPTLVTGSRDVDHAWRIAMGDMAGSIVMQKHGLNASAVPTLFAGLQYDGPWTRDGAINTWSGAGLLFPDVMANSLRSQVQETPDGLRSTEVQHWDSVIWLIGAWTLYLYSGDRSMLELAHRVAVDFLAFYEETEFDPGMGLFRGPAGFNDGISGYPDRYAADAGGSGIVEWIRHNPDKRVSKGMGTPFFSLSTNCIYAEAYRVAGEIAGALERDPDPSWGRKRRALMEAVNRHFWSEEKQCYRYLVDADGGCDVQEAQGVAMAALFGVASGERLTQLMDHVYSAPAGLPCLWPPFERYAVEPGAVGRHCGCVWPQNQGLWAEAAARQGRMDIFEHEFRTLTANAVRDSMFSEIYHPESGAIYGGVQECEGDPAEGWKSWCVGRRLTDGAQGMPYYEWASLPRQVWGASAYVRMVLMGLFGMAFSLEGIRCAPKLLAGMDQLDLLQLPYRGAVLDVHVRRDAQAAGTVRVDGVEIDDGLVPAGVKGVVTVDVAV